MPEKWWKTVERRVARIFNGKRIPITGRAGMPDVVGRGFAVEVKARTHVPGWLNKAMEQALLAAENWRQAQKEPVRALVWLHVRNRPFYGDLVVMEARDFIGLLKECGLWDSGTDDGL